MTEISGVMSQVDDDDGSLLHVTAGASADPESWERAKQITGQIQHHLPSHRLHLSSAYLVPIFCHLSPTTCPSRPRAPKPEEAEVEQEEVYPSTRTSSPRPPTLRLQAPSPARQWYTSSQAWAMAMSSEAKMANLQRKSMPVDKTAYPLPTIHLSRQALLTSWNILFHDSRPSIPAHQTSANTGPKREVKQIRHHKGSRQRYCWVQ